MIILDNTPLFTWEEQRCINRLESVIFSTEMFILQTRTYCKVGNQWDWQFKFLKCKNEIITTDRAQRVDEKNDVICLVMFTSKVMVIRMSKMAHLMNFYLNTEKNRPSLGKWVTNLNASERSYLALLQNTMDYGVLSYH